MTFAPLVAATLEAVGDAIESAIVRVVAPAPLRRRALTLVAGLTRTRLSPMRRWLLAPWLSSIADAGNRDHGGDAMMMPKAVKMNAGIACAKRAKHLRW